MFPVAFHQANRKRHGLLRMADFEQATNAAGQPSWEVPPERLNQVLQQLMAVRKKMRSRGGEIRVYSRSLQTRQALLKTIHPTIRAAGFVREIGIAHPHQDWRSFPGQHIVLSTDGHLTAKDRALLMGGLDKVILVMMSGGDGRSDEAFYNPMVELMQEILHRHIGLWAICMSYQVLLDRVLRLGVPKQHILPPLEGLLRIGTQLVDGTRYAQTDAVWRSVYPRFAVESFNHYRIIGAQQKKNLFRLQRPEQNYTVKVLGRDHLTKEIIAVKVNDLCWAMQYHPELKKIVRAGRTTYHTRTIQVGNKKIKVPASVHPYQIGFIERLANTPHLFDRYHIEPKDIEAFFQPARLVHNVGDQLTFGIIEQVTQTYCKRLHI